MRTALLAPCFLCVVACFHDLRAADLDAVADAGETGELRWAANGPRGEVSEGPYGFDLACEDGAGQAAACDTRCAYDGAAAAPCVDRYELAWAEAGLFEEPRTHRLCVAASAPGAGVFGAATCREFRALPYPGAYRFRGAPPGSLSTRIEVALACARPDDAAPSDRCGFACSLDARPYAPCRDRYVADRVVPGPHTLRIEVRGPSGTLEERFTRIAALSFTIDDDATPEVATEPIPELVRLSDEELDARGVLGLVAAYGEYAASCARDMDAARARGERAMAEYLSRGLDSTLAQLGGPETISACVDALGAGTTTCTVGEHFHAELGASLPVALPAACDALFVGRAQPGERCFNGFECAGRLCEGGVETTFGYGYCAGEAVESHEGIMCGLRRCGEGLYCDARLCARTLAPGERCDPAYASEDCGPGAVCSGGDVPRCAPDENAPGG